MGTRTSSLSTGTDQEQLDTHLDTQPGDHQDQVWFCHLWSLSSPVGSRTKAKRRSLSVRRQEAHFALDAARQREQTEAVKKEYAKRAGVEGVHAKAGAYDGLAPLALHWGASDSSSACRDRDRHEWVSIA